MFNIAIAIGLHQGRVLANAPGSWVLKDSTGAHAVLDLDTEHDRGWHDGTSYSRESAALLAVGGTAAGATRTIGPHLPPANPNLVVNGNGNPLTGWTGFQGGAIASVNGEIELTAAGTLSGFSQAVTLGAGRAAIGSARGRRGTTPSTCYVFTSSNNSTLNGSSSSFPIVTITTVSGALTVSGRKGGVWIGGRNSSATGGGSAYFSKFDLREAVPFTGWDSASDGVTILVDFTTPASLTASQVIAQSGIQSERDRIRVELSSSFGLVVSFRVNNTDYAALDLGRLAPSTRQTLSFAGNAIGNSFAASLNGGLPVTDNAAELPGATHLWIGRSYSGEMFQGAIHRLAVVNGRQPNWWLQAATAPADTIWTEGDSYVANTGGTGLSQETRTVISRDVITTAVGGSAITDVEQRVAARAERLRGFTFVLWDGSPNDYGSVGIYCDHIASIIGRIGHERFVLIPPGVPYAMPSTNALSIRAEMQARWPGHILDWRDWIANTDGVIDNNRMLNYPDDLYHLNAVAQTEIATGLKAFLRGKGW